jgi:hypothetical protein
VLIVVLFWILALLCCSHAVVCGGRDGRLAVFLIVAATLLTAPAMFGRPWAKTELAILAVDLLLLAGLYALMLASRRYWPIWMTGFHLVAVVTHVSTMLVPSFTPKIYKAMESFWAIPVLLSLLIGVELDRRAAEKARLAAAGASRGGRHEP